jgi:hypothetical protein
MMFMIPEVLVNFAMKNLLKMFWQRRSKSIKSINSLILKRRKSLRRKAILGRDEKLKYFDGSFKWVALFFSFQCIWIVCLAYGIFGNDIDYLSSWIIGICLCWHYRAKYVGNDTDRDFLVLILYENRSHMGLSIGYTQLYLKIPTPVY